MKPENGDKKTERIYPWYVLVISDILLTAAILCTFSYFHHVRMLWGIGAPAKKEESVYTFTRPVEQTELPLQTTSAEAINKDDEPADEPFVPHTSHILGSDGFCTVCKIDMSGDFGASFPEVFIQSGEKVSLSDDDEIEEYASLNGISLRQDSEGKYIGLYRSNDIFITVQQINTTLNDQEHGEPQILKYFVYDIYIRNMKNLFAAYSTGLRYPAGELIDMAEREQGANVVAAVNGDYLANLNHCLISERNGNVLRDIPKSIESDILVLYYDGTMQTISPSEYDWNSIEAKSPYQIWDFGPELIDGDGNAIERFDSSAYDHNVIGSTHPRTSVGYYEPGHYNFVIVDGRSKDSRGVTMDQLAQLQQALGCKAAYNMDGGDSTQAFFSDLIIRQSETRSEQRKLSDLICIGEVSE